MRQCPLLILLGNVCGHWHFSCVENDCISVWVGVLKGGGGH